MADGGVFGKPTKDSQLPKYKVVVFIWYKYSAFVLGKLLLVLFRPLGVTH